MKEKFVPYGKLSKKKKRELNLKKRNNGFGVDMRTKVVPDKTKVYKRKQRRQEKW